VQTGHGLITAVGFSPDGKRIVTGSWDQTARVWDADTGKELRRLTGHTVASPKPFDAEAAVLLVIFYGRTRAGLIPITPPPAL